jgi:hypothetical protein
MSNFLVQQQGGNKNTQEDKQWIPTVLLHLFNIRMAILEGAFFTVWYGNFWPSWLDKMGGGSALTLVRVAILIHNSYLVWSFLYSISGTPFSRYSLDMSAQLCHSKHGRVSYLVYTRSFGPRLPGEGTCNRFLSARPSQSNHGRVSYLVYT